FLAAAGLPQALCLLPEILDRNANRLTHGFRWTPYYSRLIAINVKVIQQFDCRISYHRRSRSLQSQTRIIAGFAANHRHDERPVWCIKNVALSNLFVWT
ncbi:MAG: hypothetical protein ACK53L_02435, partial [Pirellulaceae bacterium]